MLLSYCLIFFASETREEIIGILDYFFFLDSHFFFFFLCLLFHNFTDNKRRKRKKLNEKTYVTNNNIFLVPFSFFFSSCFKRWGVYILDKYSKKRTINHYYLFN